MAKDDLIFNNPEIEDYITDYGKGAVPEIDPRTDFGKGICYKSIDGGEHASMEAVEQANKAYWDSMMIDTSSKDLNGYNEIEKAYFDSITPKVNINDKDAAHKILMAQREKMTAYIQARYGSYLEELLDEYGYGQQDNNRGLKR